MGPAPSKIQAWWWHRQGLDGSLRDAPSDQVLASCGWARSVAGIGPYLTAFSRSGASREQVDSELADQTIQELPAARGCTYVVPACDYAIALLVGQNLGQAEWKVALKLGVTEREIQKLCDGILKALERGPLDPSELREVTGSLSRSLGEDGKKKGLTTTIPIALGKLQQDGWIHRIPVDGRLDQQRYRYGIWKPNPLQETSLTQEEAYVELAKRYFRWVGPAMVSEFQWFSGLGSRATKSILDKIDLQVCESGGQRLLLNEDYPEYQSFKVPKQQSVALVSSLDTLFAARRDVRSLLSEADIDRNVQGEKTLGVVGQISELPSHAIVDRGRLIGLWEYDPDSMEIVYDLFVDATKHIRDRIHATCEYIREQLGDARSFSLDSPKSRRPRLNYLKEMQSSRS